MTVIKFDSVFPGGSPRKHRNVLVALVHGGAGGSSGAVMIGDTIKVALDVNGLGSADLAVNETITPAGTYYQCTLEGSSPSVVRLIQILTATAANTQWSAPAIQVFSPPPPSAGGGAGGVSVHNLLTGRSDADAHPTSAVTGLTAALAGKQPLDSDLTALAALTTTTYGRALLELADAAGGRTALGLGTAATSASTAFEVAGAAAAAQAASQPLDSDLTAMAALTTTTYGRAFLALADAAAGRTALGLGTAATTAATAYEVAGAAAAAQAAAVQRANHTGTQAPATIVGTAVVTADARLSDARTPTAHAASHVAAGSDALTLSKSQVGLGNVDNTTDATKPVSTAQAAADAAVLAASQPLDSDLTAIAALATTAGGISPLALTPSKGGVIVGTSGTATAILAVGANGTALVADSTLANGIKWASPVDVQLFTASGTWTKPDVSAAGIVEVICIGSGGGGGSGRNGAAATIRGGGGGGAAGAYIVGRWLAADLTASPYTITVPAGGAGGAGRASANSGIAGTAPGNTSFGTALVAVGGAGGGGGTNLIGGAGGAATNFNMDQPFKTSGSGGAGGPGGTGGAGGTAGTPGVSVFPGGGGGGGGTTTGNIRDDFGGAGGAAGAASGTGSTLITGGAAGGGASGAAGGSSVASSTVSQIIGAAGGGGGNSSDTAVAGGAGGAGGTYGGGGGGGGAITTNGSIASGAGGAGGKGMVLVITWR